MITPASSSPRTAVWPIRSMPSPAAFAATHTKTKPSRSSRRSMPSAEEQLDDGDHDPGDEEHPERDREPLPAILHLHDPSSARQRDVDAEPLSGDAQHQGRRTA